MKNLLLASISLVVLVSIVTSKPDYDYDFDDATVADGFPLNRPQYPKCSESHSYMTRPDYNKKAVLEQAGERNVTRGYHYYQDYITLGALESVPGDFSVVMAVKMLYSPEPSQVLFHSGDANGANHIELRFAGRPRKECGEKECVEECGKGCIDFDLDLDRKDIDQISKAIEQAPQAIKTQPTRPTRPTESKGAVAPRGREPIKPRSDLLRFRVTPSEVNGGRRSAVYISAALEDRTYANEWFHIVAIHRTTCKKDSSGLELYINGKRTFATELIGEESYNWAFIPPNGGDPIRRTDTFLGKGSDDSNLPYVPVSADFECVQVYPSALTKKEIASLYQSANRVLRKSGAFDYQEY